MADRSTPSRRALPFVFALISACGGATPSTEATPSSEATSTRDDAAPLDVVIFEPTWVDNGLVVPDRLTGDPRFDGVVAGRTARGIAIVGERDRHSGASSHALRVDLVETSAERCVEDLAAAYGVEPSAFEPAPHVPGYRRLDLADGSVFVIGDGSTGREFVRTADAVAERASAIYSAWPAWRFFDEQLESLNAQFVDYDLFISPSADAHRQVAATFEEDVGAAPLAELAEAHGFARTDESNGGEASSLLDTHPEFERRAGGRTVGFAVEPDPMTDAPPFQLLFYQHGAPE